MSISLYYKDGDVFSEVDSLNRVKTSHNGRSGDTVTVNLYLKNNDSTKYYKNIRIKPIDLVDAYPYGDVAYSETGWGVKLSPGSNEPSSGEWEDIQWGEEISMDDIGSASASDTTTYFPFWYLITCPPNEEIKTKTDIVLKLSSTEYAI